MSFSYRTTDLAKWGVGLLRKLHAVEIDLNWWSAEQRLITLESAPAPPPAIDHFESIGTSFYVHFADLSVMGPYDLPVAHYTKRGPWAPFTDYSSLDTFTENGVTYEVLLDHESAATFDAGATDGSGHDLYSAMFEPPGNSLPTGGAVGMTLTKSATGDFLATWSWKFPEGGTTGKFLRQASNTQDDVEWSDIDASEVKFIPVTGSPLSSSTDVADALESIVSSGVVSALHVSYTPDTGSSLTSSNVEDALNELGARGTSAGKKSIWVPSHLIKPLITHGATSNQAETSTYTNLMATVDYDPDTFKIAQFELVMPKSWDKGNITFKAYWSHASTSTFFDVAWQFYALAFSPGNSLDANMNEHVDVMDTGGTADTIYATDESDPLAIDDSAFGSILDNAMIVVQIIRDAGSGSDTLTVNARLHGIMVYYTTNASTDD